MKEISAMYFLVDKNLEAVSNSSSLEELVALANEYSHDDTKYFVFKAEHIGNMVTNKMSFMPFYSTKDNGSFSSTNNTQSVSRKETVHRIDLSQNKEIRCLIGAHFDDLKSIRILNPTKNVEIKYIRCHFKRRKDTHFVPYNLSVIKEIREEIQELLNDYNIREECYIASFNRLGFTLGIRKK